MTILLMAAGSGSRYGKLKQFDTLGPKDEFLMEFSIYDALQVGFDHIVVITKAANQDFLQNYLGERLPDGVRLDVLVQDINDLPDGAKVETKREKPWGTAHAVWTARDVIEDDFVIINADDYYGKAAFAAAAEFIKEGAGPSTFSIVGYNLKDTLSDHGSVSRGICTAEDGILQTIEEHTKIVKTDQGIKDEDRDKILDPNSIVSMNFWICNPSIFTYIEDYFTTFLKEAANHEKSEIYLPFVAQEMMTEGLITIKVLEANSDWFGVTYYDDKVNAVTTLDELTKNGGYPSPVWEKSTAG